VNLILYVWRQDGPGDQGSLARYEAKDITQHMSFLEMLDSVNEALVKKGEKPVAFDSDCREGICGACGQVVNGVPHGPRKKTTVCQLHMRHFRTATVYIEPPRPGSR
jgi:succinate dehydrogenase / fumarate reductase iron-sulfur subunit